MNYQKIYDQIVERARFRNLDGYRERHHVLPRCMGGDDSPENLVELTAREHFICHWLLTKIHPRGRMHHKAIHAFAMMAWCSSERQERYRVSSRLYERLKADYRKVMSRSQSGDKNSQYGSRWAHNETEQISQRFPRGVELPDGWEWGRVIDWQSRNEKSEQDVLAQQETAIRKTKHTEKKEQDRQVRLQKNEERRQQRIEQQRKENAEFFDRYCKGESLRMIAKDANCSHVGLLYRFRRCFPNKLGQIGK